MTDDEWRLWVVRLFAHLRGLGWLTPMYYPRVMIVQGTRLQIPGFVHPEDAIVRDPARSRYRPVNDN